MRVRQVIEDAGIASPLGAPAGCFLEQALHINEQHDTLMYYADEVQTKPSGLDGGVSGMAGTKSVCDPFKR